MFDLGTKIRIVASSHLKKTGPRKDSVGYVTVLSNSRAFIFNRTIFTAYASVKFIRYGNEKRHRAETKCVLLVFPVIEDNIEETLKVFINKINSEKYTSDWNEVRANMSIPENVPIVIAAPVHTPEISFKTCTHTELCCWFESCLLSQQISSFVNKALVTRHPFKNGTQCIAEQTLSILREMMVSKEMRHSVIKGMCDSPSIRDKWIGMMRMATIMAKHTQYDLVLNGLCNTVFSGVYDKDGKGSVTTTEVYTLLIPYIFHDKFDKFKGVCIDRKGFSKVIKDMEAIRKIIFTLT